MNGPHEQRIAALFHGLSGDLTRLAYLIVGDWGLAEEIVQEAFLRIWRSRTAMRDIDGGPAYARRVVVNLSRSRVRRLALERRVRRSGDTAVALETDLSRLDLVAALSRLPVGKRACVVLRYYLDLSEAETADVLGISVGTVKSQTSKALRLLATRLPAYGPVVGTREDGVQ